MEFIEMLFMSKWFLRIDLLLGTLLTIALLVYAFSKEGKDERGRGIIGTSCLIGIISMFILFNVLAGFTQTLMKEFILIANAEQLVYTLIILIIDILILILRKTR